MIRNLIKISVIFSLIMCMGFVSFAQNGTNNSYSPYSIYGVGDLNNQGTSFNKTMGGIGIATRNHRYINFLNPAAITERDTLAFMLDAGIELETKLYKQGRITSAHNIFNISNLVFTVPIYKKSAFVMGITPYSTVAYNFYNRVNNNELVANTQSIYYSSNGNGGIYSLFVGGAVTLWDRLSLGAQFIYYFGNINKKSKMQFLNSSYRSFEGGYIMQLSAFSGKLGIQYNQNIGNDYSLILGATYKPSAKIRGYITDYRFADISSKRDTLKYNIDTLNAKKAPSIAGEFGLGLSLKKGDSWMFELDYSISNWKSSKFGNYNGFANVGEITFYPSVSQSVNFGFEFIPNKYDIRYYFNKCAYRGGLYYKTDYFTINKNKINAFGITFGITFPLNNFHNGINVGVDIGQRGGLTNNLIKENYGKVYVSFNISDMWFIKPRYN